MVSFRVKLTGNGLEQLWIVNAENTSDAESIVLAEGDAIPNPKVKTHQGDEAELETRNLKPGQAAQWI
jgi:hypothetical protein